MAVLVVADHDNSAIVPIVLNTVTAATAIDADVHVLVAGNNAGAAAVTAAKVVGVSKVLHVDGAAYEHQLAEALAPVVVAQAGSYSHILFPSNTTGKNVAPRVAALLDVAQISDIVEVVSGDTFVRPIYAGNAIATVQTSDKKLVITVRGTAFPKAAATGGSGTIEAVAGEGDKGLSTFAGAEIAKSERPELTSAKVIVSGGRALGSSEQFHAQIDPLADKLGAAVGAFRRFRRIRHIRCIRRFRCSRHFEGSLSFSRFRGFRRC